MSSDVEREVEAGSASPPQDEPVHTAPTVADAEEHDEPGDPAAAPGDHQSAGGGLGDTVPEGSIRRARLAAEAAARAHVGELGDGADAERDAADGANARPFSDEAPIGGLPSPKGSGETTTTPPLVPSVATTPLTPSAEVGTGKRLHPSYLFLGLATAITLALDLASKGWAKGHFDGNEGGPTSVVLIDELFSKINLSLIYAKNRGGAWGLLQDQSEAVRRPFFLVVSVAAIVFIVSLYRKLTPAQRALKWGLPLVLGGALGNLIDRIRYGFVVDFIDVFFSREDKPAWHWPTFNVADIAICVGVLLMAIDMFTSRPRKKKKASAPPVTSDAAVGGAAPPNPTAGS